MSGRGRVARLIGLLGLPVVLFSGAAAQEGTLPSAPFRLAHFVRVDDGFYYHYKVVNPTYDLNGVLTVYLPVDQPADGRRPRILGTRGPFLFDALREGEDAALSHPPLHIATPQGWSAAIYVQGALSWGRWQGESPQMPVREETGFEITSPALPALREYKAVVRLPLGSRQSVTGLVLAPGWDSVAVSPAFLSQQLSIGCRRLLVSDCERYEGLLRRLSTAREAGLHAEGQRLLRLWVGFLDRDTTTHRNVRFVLREAGSVLLERSAAMAPDSGG